MSDFLDKLTATESQGKLGDLKQRLFLINRDLRNAMMEAQGLRDPDLSPEGLQNRRRQLEQVARDRAAKQLEALQAEQRQHAARIRSWADSKRPRIADDPIQLQKASLAWDRARAMLDAGRSMPEVIAKATDPSMLLAIREWGPDYLRAQFPREDGFRLGAEDPDTGGLVRSADARLAELLGGEVATAHAMRRDLDVLEAGWAPSERSVTNTIAGVKEDPMALMTAAFEAKYAEDRAAAGYQEPTPSAAGAPAGDAA